jgi:hypothetical protein
MSPHARQDPFVYRPRLRLQSAQPFFVCKAHNPSWFTRRTTLLGLQGAQPFFVYKAHTLFRRKPVFPFFDIHTDSPGSAKHMAEHGVGLQPNVACEFKTGRLS